ncbi:hypothetical protein N0V87_010042 [Didymella glomerata]|jgi:hypothetical protein|uniref:Uncharacterized protein n=1 Tax=Didymella glomerata TaxID=749621 RepID=A0A9W9BV34_9PLEO|nr:hypothetical protein N0V87_010042 [Didymella glomerata]
MSCRDEFLTQENGVAEERLPRKMRLARIADVWEYRRTVEYNKWVTEYNRHVDELNKAANQQQDLDEKYLMPWVEDLEALDDELGDLLDKWKSGEDVTPVDWDAVTKGKERKAIYIVHYDLPKEAWPLPVRDQFPDLIAVTMELKRLAGDTSDGVGWQTSMTAEQIERLRKQLEMDQTLFEEDVVAMLLDHLRYEDVISQDFDAYAWVRKMFQKQNLSPGEALQRAAQMVHAWVEYWQIHSEGEAGVLGGKVLDKNINHGNELFVPVEPVLDQFGMDLYNETEHTGEYFLPFDT